MYTIWSNVCGHLTITCLISVLVPMMLPEAGCSPVISDTPEDK